MGFGGSIPLPGTPQGGGAMNANIQVPGYAGSGAQQMSEASQFFGQQMNNLAQNKMKRDEIEMQRQRDEETRRQYDLTLDRLNKESAIDNTRQDKHLDIEVQQAKRAADTYERDTKKKQEIEDAHNRLIPNTPRMMEVQDKIMANTATDAEKAEWYTYEQDLLKVNPSTVFEIQMKKITDIHDPEKKHGRMIEVALKNPDGSSIMDDYITKLNTSTSIGQLDELQKNEGAKIFERVRALLKTGHMDSDFAYRYLNSIYDTIAKRRKSVKEMEDIDSRIQSRTDAALRADTKAATAAAPKQRAGDIVRTELADGTIGMDRNGMRMKVDPTTGMAIIRAKNTMNGKKVDNMSGITLDSNGKFYIDGQPAPAEANLRYNEDDHKVYYTDPEGQVRSIQIDTWKDSDVASQQTAGGKISNVKPADSKGKSSGGGSASRYKMKRGGNQ